MLSVQGQFSMILYCSSTGNKFLNVVVLNAIFVQQFARIFMKELFSPLEKKIPALTYVVHLSADILNAIYYGPSFQNSLNPHFHQFIDSCF